MPKPIEILKKDLRHKGKGKTENKNLIDFTMIERNGGTWVESTLQEFLHLIRTLIDPDPFKTTTKRNRCYNCTQLRKTRVYTVVDSDGNSLEWTYCKECALSLAIYMLDMQIGEE